MVQHRNLATSPTPHPGRFQRCARVSDPVPRHRRAERGESALSESRLWSPDHLRGDFVLQALTQTDHLTPPRGLDLIPFGGQETTHGRGKLYDLVNKR